ncbi:isoprenoid synthase domain-containing protein [Pelagophyceae sp. CCMP2097]|nr:isoprenoid synthase domain-containing protein [Pelagophyceae sp. CCMP2097]
MAGDLHRVDDSILEPYKYISETPGKDIRGQLIDAFNQWLEIPPAGIDSVKSIVSQLHNASLLVDDIEDGSNLRRGVPVAHAIFGIPSTLNCANYVYFIALEQCHRLDNRAALSVFVAELLALHRGQGQDILWRDRCTCPSEAEYTRMVLDKTGGLFRLAVGMMQALSTHPKHSSSDFAPLVDRLALYFQIRDDLVNLRSDEYMQSKSYCEDLTEGKFSFPIIHAVHARPDDTRLLNILKQRTTNVDVKKHAVDFMQRAGSFEYTRLALRRIRGEIHAEIEALGGHAVLAALIDHLHNQTGVDEDEPEPPPADSPPAPGHIDSL